MMIDKKEFWNGMRIIASDELARLAETNLIIAKSERKIVKLLKSDKIDIEELGDEWSYLTQERCTISYFQGLQDGTKMLHLLLSGEAVNHMQRLEGEKADNKREIDFKKTTGVL